MKYLLLSEGKDVVVYLIDNYKAKNVMDFINEFVKEENGERLGVINVESKYYSHDIDFAWGKADIPTERYVIMHHNDGRSYFKKVPLRLQDFRIISVAAENRYGTWLVYVKAREEYDEIETI